MVNQHAASGFGDAVMILWILFAFLSVSHGAIGQDGLCSLFIYVPFTYDGSAFANQPSFNGFNHLAGALLAMEQFNARNDSVVPELSQLKECQIRFDLTKSKAFDTGTFSHLASRSLFDIGEIPCAIAGPYNDVPALELSTMAQAGRYPLVSHRAFSLRVTSDFFSPFSSQTMPDMFDWAQTVWFFLQLKGRTSFISVLYAQSDTGLSRRETLSIIFDGQDIAWESRAYGVTDSFSVMDVIPVLQQLKETGFRTIVVGMEVPFFEFPVIAEAAEALGMNNGDYFWVWFGQFDSLNHNESGNENITKLATGSAWIFPMPLHFFNPDGDPFRNSWHSQGAGFVDRLNAINPMQEGEQGYLFAEPDFMRVTFPDFGSEFMYDAVMSIGIGACLAERVDNTTTGEAHLQGIRNSTFTGATGKVEFLRRFESGDRGGARQKSNVYWGTLNLFPPQPEGAPFKEFELTDFLEPDATEWTAVNAFVYADGRTVPPDLRDLPEQNYLSPGLRALGLSLMALCMFLAVVSIGWVYIYREHRVLRAAQPHFLYLLAVGSIVSVSTIITVSFDESYDLSDTQLSMMCMATPWLLSLGHILTYGALFSKLWRVNQVLQFVRRKIDLKQVAWPVLILMLAALLVLGLWTGLDSLQWERHVTNDITFESIGKCESENIGAFIAPLVVIMTIPTMLTGYMAYKTKDVDDSFSESWWIFILIVIHLEVIIISVPLFIILEDVSTNGRYIGLVFLFWTFPMCTLALIMIPKSVAHYRAVRGTDGPQRIRGQRDGGVHVTGLNNAGTPTQSKESKSREELSDAFRPSNGTGTADSMNNGVDND